MPLAQAPVMPREVPAPSPTMKTFAAHPEVTVEEDGLVGVHLDLRIVHDGARVEDAGDDGVELLQRAQMWRMIFSRRGTASLEVAGGDRVAGERRRDPH